MNTNELYLLTAFVCSACDGEIASEEIELIKKLDKDANLFHGIDVEGTLNNYVAKINEEGIHFINAFIDALANAELSDSDQVKVIEVAIKMIEADNKIEYAEVKFFKKLRAALTVSDDKILEAIPGIEDYLQPDIRTADFEFNLGSNFNTINLCDIESK